MGGATHVAFDQRRLEGQPRRCLALRHLGEHVVAQRSMHSSVMDGMVLGGLHGHFVAPDVDAELGAAHGLRPESLADGLDARPDAVAAYVVTPSGSSRQTGMGSVRSPTTRTRREADQTLAGALPRESCPLGAMHGTGPADSASGVPGRAGACEACESAVVLRQLGADPCPAPSDGRWSCSL